MLCRDPYCGYNYQRPGYRTNFEEPPYFVVPRLPWSPPEHDRLNLNDLSSVPLESSPVAFFGHNGNRAHQKQMPYKVPSRATKYSLAVLSPPEQDHERAKFNQSRPMHQAQWEKLFLPLDSQE